MKNQTQRRAANPVKSRKNTKDYLLSDDAFYLFALAVKYKKLCGAKALQQLLAQGA